jgi:hypothetical protein
LFPCVYDSHASSGLLGDDIGKDKKEARSPDVQLPFRVEDPETVVVSVVPPIVPLIVKLNAAGVGSSLLGTRTSTKKSPAGWASEAVKVKFGMGFVVVGVTDPLSKQLVPMMQPCNGSKICAEHGRPTTLNIRSNEFNFILNSS